jgi:hypothetical protein
MVKLNGKLLKIVAGFEAIRARLRRSEPLVTPDAARLAGNFFQFQNNKIITELGFEFRPLDDTLDWCCEYYMQKFALKKG